MTSPHRSSKVPSSRQSERPEAVRTPALDLDEAWLQETVRILAELIPERTVLAYGSRVRGAARRHSDLDLLICGDTPIAPHRLDALRDAFAASDLPIRIDLHDDADLPPSWRATVWAHHVVLQEGLQGVGPPGLEPGTTRL
ncbi:MAG: nucleotidyltransferase domain-containing protein [Polyangiales bacterium]